MKRGSRTRWNKSGQIWVETVIYTLIAFAMIGLALAFVTPRIEEIRDKGIVEQSIALLEDVNDIINSLGGSGNQRIVELGINKGDLKIDGVNDRLVFELESGYTFSQPGENITLGNVVARTEEIGNLNDITLTLYYEDSNIKYDNSDELRIISRASTPYRLLISHLGEDSENKTIVNIEILN